MKGPLSLMALTCISQGMFTGLLQALWVTLGKLLNESVCKVLICKMWVDRLAALWQVVRPYSF